MLNNYRLILLILILSLIFLFWYIFYPVVDTFDTNKDITIVNYNTEWCGYSKQFQPNWNKFASMVDGKIKVVDMKCDNKDNEEKCKAAGINGYPTVKLYVDNKVFDYNGNRQPDDLIAFVKQHAL